MHASTVELLSLRDREPVAAAVAGHVAGCLHCTAELARLATVRERLSGLPQPAVEGKADELWNRVRDSLDARPASPATNRYLALAAVAVWAVVAMVWFVVADRDPVTDRGTAAAQGTHSLESLVIQSRELEGVLLELPKRPHVEQAATAATLDALEGRIQWLDYALSSSAASGDPAEQVAMLWEERVELLDSLVTLRYAQAGRMSF